MIVDDSVFYLYQIMVGGILGRLACLFLFREVYNANKSKDRGNVTVATMFPLKQVES